MVNDVNAPWQDPMADPTARSFAQDARGIASAKQPTAPEWKKSVFNLSTTFGRITSLSIQEQRECLPIYKLRGPLVRAMQEVCDNKLTDKHVHIYMGY